MIEEITIQGYKSIKELNNFKLNRLNVLIGANGSGKSNFLSVFELLRNIYMQNLQKYILDRGNCDRFLHFGKKKTEKIFIGIENNLNNNKQFYFITLLNNINNNFIIQYESISEFKDYTDKNIKWSSSGGEYSLKENDIFPERYSGQKYSNTSNLLKDLNIFNKDVVYHFHDTSNTSSIKSTPAINDNKIFKQDGANLASYLLMIKNKYPSYYQNIVQTIQLVAPFFHDFELRDNNGYTMLEWYHKDDLDTPLYPSVLSDGTLRFICLTTLLMQPVELIPETVLIDEPELGLHPYAINILYAMLEQVSQNKQIIITTHSIELINQCNLDYIIVVDQEDGISSFKRYNQDELKNWINDYKYSIGDMWKSNIIGGTP